MIESYKKELENATKNVDFSTKRAHFHMISIEELDLMYKNFYEINNLNISFEENLDLDNYSFFLYENWLARFNDY